MSSIFPLYRIENEWKGKRKVTERVEEMNISGMEQSVTGMDS
jgi:hypothetical protein